MRASANFFGSMTGRVFLILLVGVALSATIAWSLADFKRRADLRHLDVDRAVDQAEQVLVSWRATPVGERASFTTPRTRGVEPASPGVKAQAPDAAFTEQLGARVPGVTLEAGRGTPATCRGGRGRPGGPDREGDGDRGSAGRGGLDGGVARLCWLVTAQEGADRLSFVVGTPPRVLGAPLVFDPLYLAVLVMAAGVMAFFVARMAAAPLRHLAQAATELGDDLTRRPLPIIGSSELRSAAQAFNAMQARLQRQLAERTEMLAAITHDLQTPVTRLRLRLEKVQDPELRERLLGDLAAMQTLIREGLELARSAERAEDRVVTDLQSLVDSIVDDAADAGQAVTTGARLDVDVSLQPEGMRRCLCNLIDNALKYGGAAEVSIVQVGGKPAVIVADRGPGMSEADLEAVFQPFVRLEDSRSRETGGAGLGLTIARTLAERNGASLVLRNRTGGGLEAVVQFR